MEQEKKYFDIQYIHKFQHGDEHAFEVIYEYYKQHIYYMGMQFFHHDNERAKDLVQNTFSEVYRNIKKLKSAEAFYVWMNQIAYHQCCNMLRYHAKDISYYTVKVDEEYVEQYIPDDKQKDLLLEMQKKDAVDIVFASLNQMDEDKRLVGYLRYFEELSLKEISEITGMPENTVGSHLHRIKAKLKQQLEKKGFNSATCFSMLLVPNLISYYHEFVALYPPLPNLMVKDIKQYEKKITQNSVEKMWMKGAKVVLGVSIALPIMSVASVQQQHQRDENGIANTEISSVTYNQQLTNQPVSIEVETTSQEYDVILLNNSSNLIATTNGSYQIQLMKKGKLLDSEELMITNIDRDIPEVIKEEFIGSNLVLTLSDDLSGVNFKTITYYINNEISDQINIDETQHTIRVPIKEPKDARLEVSDFAGNILKVNINTYINSAK